MTASAAAAAAPSAEIIPARTTMTELTHVSLFSGIGAFERALERLNRKYKLVGYSEIDPYPAKAYSVLHGLPGEPLFRFERHLLS